MTPQENYSVVRLAQLYNISPYAALFRILPFSNQKSVSLSVFLNPFPDVLLVKSPQSCLCGLKR